jgi:hypothetical protein
MPDIQQSDSSDTDNSNHHHHASHKKTAWRPRFWNASVFYCPFCVQSPVPTTYIHSLFDHLLASHNLQIIHLRQVAPFLEDYVTHWASIVEKEGWSAVPKKHGRYQWGALDDTRDVAIRNILQQKNLERILQIQSEERQAAQSAIQVCLFCKLVCPNRYLHCPFL